MAAFDAAGIYTLIDLDTFNTTVTENTPMWTQEQFQAYAHVMDVFSGYSNGTIAKERRHKIHD